jgi:hypothetical protein
MMTLSRSVQRRRQGSRRWRWRQRYTHCSALRDQCRVVCGTTIVGVAWRGPHIVKRLAPQLGTPECQILHTAYKLQQNCKGKYQSNLRFFFEKATNWSTNLVRPHADIYGIVLALIDVGWSRVSTSCVVLPPVFNSRHRWFFLFNV